MLIMARHIRKTQASNGMIADRWAVGMSAVSRALGILADTATEEAVLSLI
jgi:hypothetical protein